MKEQSIAILGGGNTAFASAARLSLDGHKVTLCELPDFRDSIAAIEQSKVIRLTENGATRSAHLHEVTTDLASALKGSDLILVMVPAYAHLAFARACAPHLRPQHTVVLMPGTLGALQWAHVLSKHGQNEVTIAEVDTSPYVCRKTGPDAAIVWGAVTGLGLGVFPADETEAAVEKLVPLFPGITPYSDVMECGLSSLNPVIHPAGVLMNAGRIERSRGEFYFYEEGVTPSVASVVMSVDHERRKIGERLGYRLTAVNEAFHRAGFGPEGDLWATINGSRMLTQLRAPGSMDNRWLTEDMPYGIATWSLLGTAFGIETPVMRAIVEIGSVVAGFDAWEKARNLVDLGIDGLDVDDLKRYLRRGIS